MKRVELLLVIYLSMFGGQSIATQPYVTLQDGTIILGVMESVESDSLGVSKNIEVYYGIPYAEAPVGRLRFKPPVVLKSISNPYNANVIGNACLQPPAESKLFLPKSNQSEDCLFLDVFVPKGLGKTRPVLVWIHGGILFFGAGQMPMSSVLPLVAYGDIIVVTMNYRLGVLGFLTSADDLIPGNLGLKDQQFALKWVHENIEAFGGDPSRVTIMGQDAGAVSVGYHVLSPSSQGYFRNAIMESGTPNHLKDNPSATYHRKKVETLAKLVGCSEDDREEDERLLSCLQEAPAEEIMEKLALVQQELDGSAQSLIEIIVDNDFLPSEVMTLLNDGAINVENLLIGDNADEGTMQLVTYYDDAEIKPVVNSKIFGNLLSLLGLDIPLVQKIVETVYAPDPKELGNKNRDYFTEISRFLGDYLVTCGVSTFTRAASSHANVYRYKMTFNPSNTMTGATWVGASHGDELQFVFGAPFRLLVKRTTDEEKELSKKTMIYWSNFVKTGDPNRGYEDEENKLPWWPQFTAENELYKDLSTSMKVTKNTKQRECHFIDNVLPPLKKALAELDKLKKEQDESAKWSEEGQCL